MKNDFDICEIWNEFAPGQLEFRPEDIKVTWTGLELKDFVVCAISKVNGLEKSTEPALNLPVVNNSALILKVQKLEAENKLLQFMVDNGINEEEMFNSNDITMPNEM